jgi:magnesium chelatase family protein
MVGLAETSVREARVRVASALAQLGVLLDEHAITVNLAPAELRKTGAGMDVALAVGVLGAVGRVPAGLLDSHCLVGELSLEGRLCPVRGMLPLTEGAKTRGFRSIIVPPGNASEAALVDGIEVLSAHSIADVWAYFCRERELQTHRRTPFQPDTDPRAQLDFSQVRGQSTARRALEVAAAGNHNVLMMGPPGSGKTLLARLLPTILPPLTFEEALETTAIHSVAGLVEPTAGIVKQRPFRAPHHSVSDAGLVGGGSDPRPGEVSLAHNGVLFLDELAELRRSALESLRQPLEDGRVCIARARMRAWFPARPVLVAAVNPCPCGYFGHPRRPCRCSPAQRQRYLSKLSGPLVDRLDIHVHVPPVDVRYLVDSTPTESSACMSHRVRQARKRQVARWESEQVQATTNAALSSAELDVVAALDRKARCLLEAAVVQLGLSARAFVRVLRVARTIADLDEEDTVRVPHLAEAIQGRLLDRCPP